MTTEMTARPVPVGDSLGAVRRQPRTAAIDAPMDDARGRSGCGKIIPVIGTNGGSMPCGAFLSGLGQPVGGAVYRCDACAAETQIPSDVAYDRHGRDRLGYNRDGYNRAGYGRDGFYRDGYDRTGYDRAGYDRFGYSHDGFDCFGYDRAGFDRFGYDRFGYGHDGYDRVGYDRAGCAR